MVNVKSCFSKLIQKPDVTILFRYTLQYCTYFSNHPPIFAVRIIKIWTTNKKMGNVECWKK